MLSNYYEDTGVMLDYIQNATLYNCKLDYCFLENLFINNSPIGLNAPNEARFTNVTLNNLLVTAGNIGIGIANPGYELDVNGDINFTGNLFKNGVPVYTGGGGTGGNGSTSVFLTRSAQSIGTQTITTGLNILKFPDNELSSGHVVYNSTTGAFYVTLEGLYSIFVDVDFYNADKAVDLYILKNGSETSGEGRIAWVNCPANDATTINANLYLEAGDYITVNIYNYSASSFTTPYANNKVNSFAMALFNSSQWQGDIGNPISYTAASVTMLDTIITNLTVNNVLVTVGSVGIGGVADPDYKLDVFGDINLTGDIYKNDILYLPSPVYLTRSAQTQDYQTILPGINVLKFPDTGHSTGDITYNGTTGRFTVNQDGLYSVFVDVDFYNADKSVDVYILKNNIEDSINGRIAWINCPANDATSLNAMVYLEETDYITVIVRNSSSNNFTTPYDNNKVNSFAMSLMNSSSSPRASQWIGDIGSTISYTSGNVLMNDVTVSNILITNATVTGTILVLGNSLKAVSNSNTVGNLFTTGGNVGIGTTTPSQRLEVVSTLGINTNNSTGALRFTSTGDINYIQSGQNFTSDSRRPLRFTSMFAGSTFMTLDTSGNLGIGTVTPNGILHTYNTTNGISGLTLEGGYENSSTQPFIRFGAPAIASATNGYAYISTQLTGTGAAGQGGILRLFTKIADTANYSGVLINQGNVGIGMTNPSTKLDVNGDIRISQLAGAGPGWGPAEDRGIEWYLLDNGTPDQPKVAYKIKTYIYDNNGNTRLDFTSSLKNSSTMQTTPTISLLHGNVGIGTGNPSSKLQIEETTAGYDYPLTRFVRNLNTNDISASQHGLQLEIGKRTDNKRMALGVMDNGVCVIQGKEADVGYLNLSLNPLPGNVGIGTGNPTSKLHVFDPGASNALCHFGSGDLGANGVLQVQSFGSGRNQDGATFKASADNNWIINFQNTSGGIRGQIAGNGSSNVSYNTGSDRRLKKNIIELNSMKNIIKSLRPVKYEWVSDNKLGIGLIAQEVFEILPEFRPDISNYTCCTCCPEELCDDCLENHDEPYFKHEDGTPNLDKPYHYTLDYGRFTPYLIKCLQEVIQEKEAMEIELQTTKTELQSLKTFLQTKFPGEI